MMERQTRLELDFTTKSSARPALRGGWSFEEHCGTWSVGAQSTIVLPPWSRAQDHRLERDLVPCLAPPAISKQTFEVYLNGVVVLSREPTKDKDVTRLMCDIPQNLWCEDVPNLLQFQHPNAGRPSQ